MAKTNPISHPVEKVTEPQHCEFIDTLRGIAILGVMGFHTANGMTGPTGHLGGILGHGLFGVQLFFVASALTLAMSVTSRSQMEAHPVRNFFIRRFFRIAPLYYLGIVFYAVYDCQQSVFHAPDWGKAHGLLANLMLVHGWTPRWLNNIVPGGWSIGTEFAFYLVFPFLIRWLDNRMARAVGLWLLAWLGGGLVSGWLPTAFPGNREELAGFTQAWLPAQLPVFLCGLVLFLMIRRSEADCLVLTPMRRHAYSAVCLAAAAALFLLANALLNRHGFLVATPVYGASFCALGFALFLTPWKLVVNPVTVWIGKLSFSLYLTHWIAVPLVTPGLEKFLRPRLAGLPLANDLVHYTCFLGVATAALGLALLTYHLIEKPGIQCGRRLIKRLARSNGV